MFLKSPPLTLVRYANEDVLVLSPFSNKNKHQLKVASQKPLVSIKPLDACIFLTYFCSSLAMSLPILLLPMAASEFSTATTSTSSLVVSVTSKALLGGAVGKCINGFLCQEFGGKPCSVFHLMGTAVCSLFFSMATTPDTLGMAHAGIEFFVSIQWTALSVILAQHYSQDAASFSKGITTLSLASTCGQLVAKFGGVFLLQQSMDWRMVAQFGALVALLGSCLVGTLVSERPSTKIIGRQQKKPVLSLDELVGNMTESARAVLSNPLFWGIASAHAMSMIARSSDRILGEFFAHATNLPRSICGGLTLSVTAGLVHGLVSGRAFHKTKDVTRQQAFISRRYAGAVLSALALAIVAHPAVASLITSKYIMAGILVVLSACMTSCMAFQFFQIPSMVAQTFDSKKAVCISWMDATAFFMNAPIWALVGHVVATQGWSMAFCIIAALFGLGGIVMTSTITPVLEKQQEDASG